MDAQLERVKVQLKDCNVRSVALVDDAYDCPSSMDRERWQQLRDNPDNFDPENDPLESYDALVQVHGLRIFLQRHLELDVRVFGQQEALTELANYRADLWFFDLFWGTDELDPKGAAKTAAQYAKGALEHYKIEDDDLPLVVLMSSRGVVLEAVREEFARRAHVPLGCFETLAKPSFSTLDDDDDDDDDARNVFLRRLEGWLQNPGFRRRIFHFYRSVVGAAEEAKKQFLEILQSMAVGDYAYILAEGIRDDGHALGDYLLWLMEPVFVHNLHENEDVQRARRALDEVDDVDGYLLLHPSRYYERIHQHRVWKAAPNLKLENITRKPEKSSEGKSKDGQSIEKESKDGQSIEMMRLYQGDLLQPTASSNMVWMVISPACDLSFREGKRDPDTNLSIYLLPGRVLFGEAAFQELGGELTTRFSPGDGQPTVIVWSLKAVRTVPYGEIPKFVHGERLQRSWCLRRKYVLELVHQWSSRASRIKSPVALPIPRRASVVLYIRQGHEWTIQHEWRRGSTLRFIGKGKSRQIFVTLQETAAGEALSTLDSHGINDHVRRDLKKLATESFLVSINGELLWENANKEVRGYWGKNAPTTDPGKRTKFIFCVHEEISVVDDVVGEIIE